MACKHCFVLRILTGGLFLNGYVNPAGTLSFKGGFSINGYIEWSV